MISINPDLAQKIVERTMRTIPFNVNVMDARGIIIGSGEASRLGELHSGAQLALAQGHSVEIDLPTARMLPGVKPGVNLPLTVRGHICGVVGLTGEPDVVRQFGELVQATAEMILEQAQLVSELQREKRYREEFVFQLVRPQGASRTDLEAWALRLRIDIRRPHAVIVVTPCDEGLLPAVALDELQHLQSQLMAQAPDLLSAVLSERELVLIESFSKKPDSANDEAYARQRLNLLDTTVRKLTTTPFVLSIGVSLPGIEAIMVSYSSACKTLQIGRRRQPQARTHSFYDMSLPVLMSGFGDCWQAEQLRRPLERLARIDRRGGLLFKTLDAWYANNGQPGATAKSLGIHRNTLDYRLGKIGEITRLNLQKTEDRMWLFIAMLIGEDEAPTPAPSRGRRGRSSPSQPPEA